jgi:hypothetical protein
MRHLRRCAEDLKITQFTQKQNAALKRRNSWGIFSKLRHFLTTDGRVRGCCDKLPPHFLLKISVIKCDLSQ